MLIQMKMWSMKFPHTPKKKKFPTFEQDFLPDQCSIPQAGMMSWPYAYFMTASTVDQMSNSSLATPPWSTLVHHRATE